MTGKKLTKAESVLFSVIPADPAYGRNLIMLAIKRLGGIDRLVDWVGEDPKNEYAFWTKMATKLVFQEKEAAEDERARIIRELDAKIVDITPQEVTETEENGG
jgi:hypothetical protein